MPTGGWIITYTRKRVYPFDFNSSMVDLLDIAHALSNLCRFTGHCPKFYSVAEHSVHISNLLYAETKDPLIAMQGLLHDASEAYFNDLAQPIKHMSTLESYRAAERLAGRTILMALGLPGTLHPKVKKLDLQLLNFEGTKFFESIADWDQAIIDAGPPVRPVELRCMDSYLAKSVFLSSFESLYRRLHEKGHKFPPFFAGKGFYSIGEEETYGLTEDQIRAARVMGMTNWHYHQWFMSTEESMKQRAKMIQLNSDEEGTEGRLRCAI